LLALVAEREGASFTPSGVLRVELSDEELDEAIETARGLLLQMRAAD
jgi:hypothetical protein